MLREQVQALQRENLKLQSEQGDRHASGAEHDAAMLVTTSLTAWIERLVAAGASEAIGAFRDHTTAAALHETLEKLRQLTTQMTDRERLVVQPLREKCQQLEDDNEALTHKIIVLESSETTRDAQNHVEVEQSREAVAAFRGQLVATQKHQVDAAASFTAVVDAMQSQQQLYAGAISKMASLESEVAALTTQLAQQQAANVTFAEQEALKTAVVQQQLAAQQQQGMQLLQSLSAQGEALRKQLSDLADENTALRTELEAARSKTHEVSAHVRDYRAELLAASEPSTVRAQLLDFWFKGQAQIEELQLRIADIEAAEQRLPALTREVVGMKRSRRSIVENIVTLSSEVERLRSETTAAKAKCAGLEAENALFVAQLATLLTGHMTQDVITTCGAAIQRAAAEAAAVTTIVLDPVQAQKSRAEALELKNEVVLLVRQKDKLQRIIAAREDRVCSLNAIIALRATDAPHATAVAEHVLNCALVGDGDTDKDWALRRVAIYGELHAAKEALDITLAEAAGLRFQLAAASELAREATASYAASETAAKELNDRLLREGDALTRANGVLVGENEKLRAANATGCSQLQRLHAHHVVLYAFAASQSSIVVSLFEKIQSLHAEIRSALAKKDMSADSEDQLSAHVVSQLQLQLVCLQDAIEEDRAQRANWESCTAMQLAADVEKRDDILRHIQSIYSAGLKDSSKAIDDLIREVRLTAEAKLTEKCVSADRERTALHAKRHHEDIITRSLMQQMAKAAATAVVAPSTACLRASTSVSPVVNVVSCILQPPVEVHSDEIDGPSTNLHAAEEGLPEQEDQQQVEETEDSQTS